jgi:hypothetical protein
MRGHLRCFPIGLREVVPRNPRRLLEPRVFCRIGFFPAMKNPHPRDVPVVRELPPNLMGEIGRVISSHAYVEWRLNLIVYDFLHVTKILRRLVAKDFRAVDQFDLICDLISLKDVRTGVDLTRLRKSLLSATTQRDLLAHGTWVRHPQTKAFLLHLASGSWKPERNKKGQNKRSARPEVPEYGIEECRSLGQLIDGIILTIDELDSDTSGPAPSQQKTP